MKYYSYHPCIYPAMLGAVSENARPGDVVAVYDKEGQPFGAGLYNPASRVPLRMFHHGHEAVDDSVLLTLLDRAIDLRLDVLKLPESTDSFRVVHSDADGLSGLIVDKFSDVLSIEIHSLGIAQRFPQWLPRLHERLGTSRALIDVDERIARTDGIDKRALRSSDVRSVKIVEAGIRYEVNFEDGHKTGFFCDQRDNRKRIASWCEGKRVLDLCCYTGGFSINAKVTGKAEDVTGVDLDEKAIAQARRNANLNNARINWVHCDAFSYARQMQQNGERWDVVILDPPKLIHSREEEYEGLKKYEDLNRLAVSLVKPGGIFVTCSCSGLLSEPEFERVVIKATHRQLRRIQILDRTGAGYDHPVFSTCQESRYLKLIWGRVF